MKSISDQWNGAKNNNTDLGNRNRYQRNSEFFPNSFVLTVGGDKFIADARRSMWKRREKVQKDVQLDNKLVKISVKFLTLPWGPILE